MVPGPLCLCGPRLFRGTTSELGERFPLSMNELHLTDYQRPSASSWFQLSWSGPDCTGEKYASENSKVSGTHSRLCDCPNKHEICFYQTGKS